MFIGYCLSWLNPNKEKKAQRSLSGVRIPYLPIRGSTGRVVDEPGLKQDDIVISNSKSGRKKI